MTYSPETPQSTEPEKMPTAVDVKLSEAALTVLAMKNGTPLPPVTEWGPTHNRDGESSIHSSSSLDDVTYTD